MAYHRTQPKLSKLSVAIAIALHVAVVVGLLLIAANEGMLGKRATRIIVTMVPKVPRIEMPITRPVEKPIEKPPDLKQIPSPPPIVTHATPKVPTPSAPVQTQSAATVPQPIAPAPAASAPPVFLFGGGTAIESTSDPGVLYKGFLEYTLRSNWRRPEGIADLHYEADVEVEVDPSGRILGYEWKRGSGNAAWDNSVHAALAMTKSLDRSPPRGFPERVLVRFDVQTVADGLQP